MTTGTIPEWDLADRLRKSLREADIGVQEMADYIEVGRNTVSNWINGRTRPPASALRLWSMRCGIPIEWLRDGDADAGPGPGGGLVKRRRSSAGISGGNTVRRRFASMVPTPAVLVHREAA